MAVYNKPCSTKDKSQLELDKLTNFVKNIEFNEKPFKDKIEIVVESMKIPSCKKKMFITMSTLGLVKLVSAIPITKIDRMERFLANNELINMNAMMTGSMLSDVSLFSLGVAPYVSASMIIELLKKALPSLEEACKGEYGEKKAKKLTRGLTFFIGLMNGLAISYGILNAGVLIALTMAIGSVLLGEIGDFISRKGIGSGTEMLVANGALSESLGNLSFGAIASLPVLSRLMTKLHEAKVKVPTMNRKGKEDAIPFKIMSGGLMPLVLSSSVFSVIGLFMPTLINEYSGVMLVVQSVLVYVFNVFSSSIFMNVKEITKVTNTKSIGIRGRKPGKDTEDYLAKVKANSTLMGSLGLIALLVLPTIIGKGMLMSATSLFIVVGAILKVIEGLEASFKESHVVGFLKKIGA
ncbi:preprotein translocase subunit SecY [Paraclostridium bifermentans]